MMVNAASLANAGYKYLGTPYSEMDCQAFVERCLLDCGLRYNLRGSNAWYRKMTWTGTPEECRKRFRQIPRGAFLFIVEDNGKEPSKYQGDGIGNASHIGIYTGTRQGAIHSSASRGCVAESRFDGKSIRGGWNRVGLWIMVAYDTAVNGAIKEGQEDADSMSEDYSEVSYQAKVIGGKLNMRVADSKNAILIERIPSGTVVDVIGEKPEWARIVYHGLNGWAMRQFLEPIQEETAGTGAGDEIKKALDMISQAVEMIRESIGKG